MHDGTRRVDGAREDEFVDADALRAELAQLRTALTRRPVIDMAKGAIMALKRCDEDTAFKQLSEVSQTHNVKLFELATALLGDLQRQDPGTADVDRLVQRNWTRR